MALHGGYHARRRERRRRGRFMPADGTDLDNIWSSLFRWFGGQSTDRIRNNYHLVFMCLSRFRRSVHAANRSNKTSSSLCRPIRRAALIGNAGCEYRGPLVLACSGGNSRSHPLPPCRPASLAKLHCRVVHRK